MKRQTARLLTLAAIGGVSAAWGAEWAAHHRAEQRYQHAVAARQQLELEVGELRAKQEDLVGELATSEQRVNELDAAMAAKDAELASALDRLAKEQETIKELQGKMVAMQYQFDKLQARAAPSPDANAVQLDKVVVTQPGSGTPGLQGHILSVNAQWKFVVVDLGWNVVDLGDVVSIYRGQQLIAKARVERVQEQVAAATVLPEWAGSDIQINDVVRIL